MKGIFENYRFRLVILLVFAAVLVFGIIRFVQSENYRKQGDTLVKNGQIDEAILIYMKAQDIFPLRTDIREDLRGARLILESDLNYIQSYNVNAELQAVPPISQLPPVGSLKQGQFFVPILMYHHIDVNPRPQDPVWASLFVTTNALDAQLSYLSKHGFTAISMHDLFEGMNGKAKLPEKPIVLNFDDGYRTFYTNAYPLLKKYKMKATNYVITQVVGASAYLTWAEIDEMQSSGLVEFGAHTQHHPFLTNISNNSASEEILGSKSDLESHLKKPVTTFAYPYGVYNQYDVSVVKSGGFETAVSTNYGGLQSTDNFFIMPRIMVDGRETLDNFVIRITK